MAQSLNPSSPSRPPAKRLLHLLMGGAGLVLLGGGGILVGLNSKLTTLQTAAQKKDAEVSSSQQIAHRYQTTLDNYTDTQAHMKYLEASVPDKSYVPTLLAQLQGLASQTHLTMSSIRPSAPPPPAAPAAAPPADGAVGTVGTKKVLPPAYDTLNVAIDVSGTYADTSTFLYSLTRFPKIISVGSVQMHPGASLVQGGPPQVMTTLKLTAFMFHDADPAAELSAAAPAGVPAAGGPAASTAAAAPGTAPVMPAAADGSVAGSAGRAAIGSIAAARAANSRSAAQISTL